MDLNRLRGYISAQGLRWEASETPFGALSLEQKLAYLGAVPPAGTPSLQERELLAAGNAALATVPGLPAVTDWRNKDGRNWVTPVTDQGPCGSCVAFGIIAALESHVRISFSSPELAVDLSEADLWFCWGPGHGAGRCPVGGWWPDFALPGIVEGVVDAACFPYTAEDRECNRCSDASSRLTRARSWHKTSSTQEMKNLLATSGPLITCFGVYEDFFLYRGGVYSPSSSPENKFLGGHCVCVVGYDDQNQCWICKNSWGNSFGEDGFFRIAYGVCGIDVEMWAVDGVLKRAPFYLERWDEPSLFGGWLDDGDWLRVGDFMGKGHDQVLCVNRSSHTAGRIMVADFMNWS